MGQKRIYCSSVFFSHETNRFGEIKDFQPQDTVKTGSYSVIQPGNQSKMIGSFTGHRVKTGSHNVPLIKLRLGTQN